MASFLGPFEAKSIINSTMYYTASNPTLGYRAIGFGQYCGQHYYAHADGYTRADGDQHADPDKTLTPTPSLTPIPATPDAYLDMDAFADVYACAHGAGLQHTRRAGADTLSGDPRRTGQCTRQSICLAARSVCRHADGPGASVWVPDADYRPRGRDDDGANAVWVSDAHP